MPAIVELDWDSTVLGLRAGRLVEISSTIAPSDLADFGYVHARVPQADLSTLWRLESAGFRHVTVDYQMHKAPDDRPLPLRSMEVRRIQREAPGFTVSGFDVQGSRFYLDPRLKKRLPNGFWDAMIVEHCREFADFVVAAISQDGSLAGCITCLEYPERVDMFLVSVHPHYQSRGIGRMLLAEVEADAWSRGKTLSTSVVSHNLSAMNFYLRNGFVFEKAFSVLHWVR